MPQACSTLYKYMFPLEWATRNRLSEPGTHLTQVTRDLSISLCEDKGEHVITKEHGLRPALPASKPACFSPDGTRPPGAPRYPLCPHLQGCAWVSGRRLPEGVAADSPPCARPTLLPAPGHTGERDSPGHSAHPTPVTGCISRAAFSEAPGKLQSSQPGEPGPQGSLHHPVATQPVLTTLPLGLPQAPRI